MQSIALLLSYTWGLVTLLNIAIAAQGKPNAQQLFEGQSFVVFMTITFYGDFVLVN